MMSRPGAGRWPLTLACGLAVALASGCGRDAAPEQVQDESIAVTTAVAELQTLRDQVAVPGTAVPAASAEVTVYATEPSTIAELPKAEGDAVAVGDVLVRFEVPAITQDIAARQTALLDANQRVVDAQAEVDKYRPLAEKGLVARVDVESRQAALLAAQSALVQAKTQLDLAELQHERTIVRARFAGTVAGRWHQVGDAVVPGTTDPVMRIIDPTQLQFAAQVSLTEFDRIRSGQTASVQLAGASTPEPATVVFTPRPMDPAATTAEIRVALRPGTPLALNATGRVEVMMDERPNALVIPALAIKREASGSYVMVVTEDGKASRREVRVGLVAQQMAQILSGLMPGDRVITTALDLINDGTPVRVTK